MSPRTDVYAVGCVGYWLLTGEVLFSGPTVAVVVAKHLQATPEPPSTRTGKPVPDDVEALILRCLSKGPLQRPTAAELKHELDTCSVAGDWTDEEAAAWWKSVG